MEAFRLTRQKYAGSLSGHGAALYPGRWNLAGQETIYSATSRSLALLEILVHLPRKLIPQDFILQILDIPSNLPVHRVNVAELPDRWQQIPPGPVSQRFGASLLANHTFVLVPSSIVEGEWNLLINPQLPDFYHVQLVSEKPFPLDHRLFGPEAGR